MVTAISLCLTFSGLFYIFAICWWLFAVPLLARWGASTRASNLWHDSLTSPRFAAGTSGIHTVGFSSAHLLYVLMLLVERKSSGQPPTMSPGVLASV